ncbi:hypothetical protein DYB30_001775 [Aphanomyces astaci]|uniref:Kinesin-like protein n=1 Tax=Aphanomyces astaci TaxID=112090 RepID=A0A397DIB1_APHAT|nr:hypothetical protein DYB38_011348 [Aphanomyces astaci]RHY63425.1 hypothetical protein DYB34_003923 [Aphanomyces astaci]RHY65825.1 hypothetical protein DYB30_001775 [Aphanomyces astaci]
MPRQSYATYLSQHATSDEWQAACVVMLRCHQEQLVSLAVLGSMWANVPGEQGVQVVYSSQLTDLIRYRSIIAGSFDELQHHLDTSNVLALLALPPSPTYDMSFLTTNDVAQEPLLLQDHNDSKIWMQWHEERMQLEGCPLGVATLTLANHCWLEDSGNIELIPDLHDAFTVVGLLYSPGPIDNQRRNATTQVILCAQVSSTFSAVVASAWRGVGDTLTRHLLQLRLMAAWLELPLSAGRTSTGFGCVCYHCGQLCIGMSMICLGCLADLCSCCCLRFPVQFKHRQGWTLEDVEDSSSCRDCWARVHDSNFELHWSSTVEEKTVVNTDDHNECMQTNDIVEASDPGVQVDQADVTFLLSLATAKAVQTKKCATERSQPRVASTSAHPHPLKMTRPSKTKKQVDVHLRIRPLVKEELERQDEHLVLTTQSGADGTINLSLTTPKAESDDVEFVEVLGFQVPKSKPKRDKTFRRFVGIHDDVSNAHFFQATVAPLVQDALAGRTACCFAYGHTGSGKTHTILGYGAERGMYHLASQQLFAAIGDISAQNSSLDAIDLPKLQVRVNEIYNGEVYDLLNDSAKCFVREDAHGKVQIRGETVVDGDTGLVTTTASTSVLAGSHNELLEIVSRGIAARSTGNSNVHRASSRSHAIVEIEFVSDRILQLRASVDDLDSEYTRLRHERDSLEMDIFTRQHYKVEGKWVKKENAQGSTDDECTQLLDLRKAYLAVEAQKRGAQRNVEVAQAQGTLVFVDLAGSEHASKITDGIQKTDEEQQECREINKSLSALKACFRAQCQGLTGTSCYRNSKLTLVLRDHLKSEASHTAMIAAVSPSSFHVDKTIHTLQYAQLVAEK